MTAKLKIVPKVNNYCNQRNKGVTAANQFKYCIFFEAFLGINRLYMLDFPKAVLYGSRIYNFLLIITVFYFIMTPNYLNTASFIILKYSASIELLLLMIFSIFLFQSQGVGFNRKLYKVDEILNILYEKNVTNSNLIRQFIWLTMNLLFNVTEIIYLIIYLPDFMTPTTFILYIPIIAHESEQIYFTSILRIIYMRLLIVKAHVVKVTRTSESTENLERGTEDSTAALAKNVTLDVTSLHRVYETLHHCAEHLNTIMSFPVSADLQPF